MNGVLPVNTVPDFLSDKDIEVLKKTMLKEFPVDQQESFIRLCQRTRLDPFTKQIHATKRMIKNKDGTKTATLVPVTGIAALTAIATRTGEYDGCQIHWCGMDAVWREEWLDDEPPAAAKCVVYHKHRTHPEVAIARWTGFAQQVWDYDSKSWVYSDFWLKMPDYMLSKCAKAAALRGAWPDQVSGMYITEELESGITEAVTIAPDADEEKIASNQRGEREKAASGVKFVEHIPGTRQPTPQEAMEPAFDEDKAPPKPPFGQQLKKDFPQQQPVSPAAADATADDTDDIDMTPTGPADQERPATGQTTPVAGTVPPKDVPPAKPAWMGHVIKSIPHKDYYGKKIGELDLKTLVRIETQWMPKIQASWDDANEAQKEEYGLFGAAIAHYKMEKPF